MSVLGREKIDPQISRGLSKPGLLWFNSGPGFRLVPQSDRLYMVFSQSALACLRGLLAFGGFPVISGDKCGMALKNPLVICPF